ncbi:MAG: TolC family protein [Planctomycetota bacterium]
MITPFATVDMSLPRSIIPLVLTLAPIAAGCKCPSACCIPATPQAPCVYDLAIPDASPPDLMRLVPDCAETPCDLSPLPTSDETYRLLEAAECQCNAAANSNGANMVELERHWAQVVIECDSKYVARNLCMNRDLLSLHAVDLRNKAAASAMEAYYQLAALEARSHYLDLGIAETRQTLKRLEQIEQSSLPADQRLDTAEVARRLHELEDNQLQLRFLRVQLNGQLQKLLGCPLDETQFFWPNVDWTPNLQPVDVPAELAEGLATRVDMRGIELVRCNLDRTTLRVARGVLQISDSTVGSVEPTEGLIHLIRCARCSEHELGVRCRQLAMLQADTMLLAEADIKSAAYEITLQQQRVVLAREAVAQRRERLYELRAKVGVEEATVFDVSQAAGRLYEAESTLIQQVTALKIAEVRLRRSTGALALECGFTPILCTPGCCNGPCMRCDWPTCRCPQSACGRCSCLK